MLAGAVDQLASTIFIATSLGICRDFTRRWFVLRDEHEMRDSESFRSSCGRQCGERMNPVKALELRSLSPVLLERCRHKVNILDLVNEKSNFAIFRE